MTLRALPPITYWSHTNKPIPGMPDLTRARAWTRYEYTDYPGIYDDHVCTRISHYAGSGPGELDMRLDNEYVRRPNAMSPDQMSEEHVVVQSDGRRIVETDVCGPSYLRSSLAAELAGGATLIAES